MNFPQFLFLGSLKWSMKLDMYEAIFFLTYFEIIRDSGSCKESREVTVYSLARLPQWSHLCNSTISKPGSCHCYDVCIVLYRFITCLCNHHHSEDENCPITTQISFLLPIYSHSPALTSFHPWQSLICSPFL